MSKQSITYAAGVLMIRAAYQCVGYGLLAEQQSRVLSSRLCCREWHHKSEQAWLHRTTVPFLLQL